MLPVMPAGRPRIPADLKRRLLVEAGHRCAIPTCRTAAPLQIEHIDDWAIVQRHDFENMIVLCANCHGRKGERPGQIDRRSLRQYKANLAVINSRYSTLERRVLEVLAEKRDLVRQAVPEDKRAPGWERGVSVALHGTMRIMMMYLLKDQIVEIAPPGTFYIVGLDGKAAIEVAPGSTTTLVPEIEYYRLTDTGVAFLEAWLGAQPIEVLVEDDDVSEGDDRG